MPNTVRKVLSECVSDSQWAFTAPILGYAFYVCNSWENKTDELFWIECTIIHWSSVIILCSFHKISGAVSLFGHLSCGISWTLSWQHLNSATHFSMTEIEGEVWPYTFMIDWVILTCNRTIESSPYWRTFLFLGNYYGSAFPLPSASCGDGPNAELNHSNICSRSSAMGLVVMLKVKQTGSHTHTHSHLRPHWDLNLGPLWWDANVLDIYDHGMNFCYFKPSFTKNYVTGVSNFLITHVLQMI